MDLSIYAKPIEVTVFYCLTDGCRCQIILALEVPSSSMNSATSCRV